MAAHGDIRWRRQSRERALRVERRNALRPLPRQRAADRARAWAQPNRKWLIRIVRQTRPSEAHHQAATVEPCFDGFAVGRRKAACVRQDQRLHARIDEVAHLATLQTRIRLQGAIDVIELAQQRLAFAGCIDKPDARPRRAFRHQPHRAGALFTHDAHARGALRDFRRQRDGGAANVAREPQLRRAERAALRGFSCDSALIAAARPAAHFDLDARGGDRSACDGPRRSRRKARRHGPFRCEHARQVIGALIREAICDPNNARVIALHALDAPRGVRAVRAPRGGIELRQARARVRAGERFAHVLRADLRRSAQDKHLAARAFRFARGGHRRIAHVCPERCACPTIVDHDQRAPSARGDCSGLGRERRARKADDHQRRHQCAQEHEPEWGAFAALLFRFQSKQQARWRKHRALRRRRRRAQQPPQRRQRHEREQRPRRGECDRA